MKCKKYQDELVNYLLKPKASDGSSARTAMTGHLATCERCRDQAAQLKWTMNLLDEWEAPEPSPYFDQKMAVKLREAQANPPLNWLEKMRERLLFNTGRQFRPAMAGALALVLVLGGGSYIGVSGFNHPAAVQASAAVNDLQILDNNQQAIQQMDQLLQDDDSNDPNAAQPAS